MTTSNVLNTVEQLVFFADSSTLQLAFNPLYLDEFSNLYFDEDRSNHFKLEPLKSRILVKYMYPYLIRNENISRICLYNMNGDFLYGGDGVEAKDIDAYISEVRINGLKTFFGSKSKNKKYEIYNTDMLYQDQLNSTYSGYVSVIRPLNLVTVLEGETIGYIEVQIPISGIKKQLEYLLPTQKVTVKINGVTIIESGEFEQAYNITTSSMKSDDGLYEVMISQSNGNGLKVIIITISMLIITLILLMFIVFRVQKIVIRKITDPLIQLCNKMQYIDVTDSEELDEIQELNNSFNYMIANLQKSVDKVVVAKTSQLNAQMLALQAHVDPHFIHNTLAVVVSLSEEGEVEKVRQVIAQLSTMIRYSSDYSEKEIQLIKELYHISDYLDLMKIRYEDDFEYSISGSDQVKNIQVQKFILQPIVENAFKHSLKLSEYPWKINIDSVVDEDSWKVFISDNGVKISDEKVAEVKADIKSISDSDVGELVEHLKIGGYSLMNVAARMRIIYDDLWMFDIFANEQGGTTVMIGGNIR